MWSVWAETVELYLCRGMAWVASAGNAPQVFKTPATVPLAILLGRVAEGLAARGSTGGRRRRFRVYLGSSLCPPVRFDIPEGAVWRDLPWAAQRQAPLALGVKPADAAQLVCALSPSVTGLAAAMHITVKDAIEAWTTAQKGRCISMEPMWSHLTHFHRSALEQCDGLAIQEPDGHGVFLGIREGQCAQASTRDAGEGDLGEGGQGSRKMGRLTWQSPVGPLHGRHPLGVGAWGSCFIPERA